MTPPLFSEEGEGEIVSSADLALIREAENSRIQIIDKVYPTVVAIYGDDPEAGGGSGVLIDPAGYAITNYHVVEANMTGGWAGLADRQLYRWELIGFDPGGDLAMIRLLGRDDFPCSPLGDSNQVRVGDWGMAIGNPFLLAEDQRPTVTLGIVSGVARYQEGAGSNTLVYGNCLQVDSSINPGNSGGPLFSMQGEVIGINGRGSFHQDRGRVNVGLGYAISSEQIKYFFPDLLATKFARHGTMDALFGIRGGKIVCDSINLDSAIAQDGLCLGDELITFEDIDIHSVNQYTNLMSMLPEDWPVKVVVRTVADGQIATYRCRLAGLPYSKQYAEDPENPEPEAPEQPGEIAAEEGMISDEAKNRQSLQWLYSQAKEDMQSTPEGSNSDATGFHWSGRIVQNGETLNPYELTVQKDGTFVVDYGNLRCEYDGSTYQLTRADGTVEELSAESAGQDVEVIPAFALSAMLINASDFGNNTLQYQDWQLEGSDKAQNRRSYRIQATDEDESHFFLWLSVIDREGSPFVSLLKAGRDKDAGARRPAVTFHNYKDVDGLMLPHHFRIVIGLEEAMSWEIIADECTVIENNLDENESE